MRRQRDIIKEYLSDRTIIDSILDTVALYPASKQKKLIAYLKRRGKHEAAEAVRLRVSIRKNPPTKA